MCDVFISYARQDRDLVRPLAERLERLGWTVFWDVVIPLGKTWDEVIEAELSKAKVVLVIWSENSVGSSWVRAEAQEGLDRGILVPVIIGDIRPPLRFRPVQSAQFEQWGFAKPSRTLSALTDVIAARIGVDLPEDGGPARDAEGPDPVPAGYAEAGAEHRIELLVKRSLLGMERLTAAEREAVQHAQRALEAAMETVSARGIDHLSAEERRLLDDFTVASIESRYRERTGRRLARFRLRPDAPRTDIAPWLDADVVYRGEVAGEMARLYDPRRGSADVPVGLLDPQD